MKVILLMVLLLSTFLLNGCASHGDACGPELRCDFVKPLPSHADHVVRAADGSLWLKGI
jgi:hypothetical protein